MVTAELAIGILSATMLAIGLMWGINLVIVHTECSDVAAQVARAEARGDAAAAAQARAHAPEGSTLEVEVVGNEVHVRVSVPVSLGHLLTITVSGDAVMPKEPGT